MTKVLITGAQGFIGRNLVARLLQRGDLEILRYDLDNEEKELDAMLRITPAHLVGV